MLDAQLQPVAFEVAAGVGEVGAWVLVWITYLSRGTPLRASRR